MFNRLKAGKVKEEKKGYNLKKKKKITRTVHLMERYKKVYVSHSFSRSSHLAFYGAFKVGKMKRFYPVITRKQ